MSIYDTLGKKTARVKARQVEKNADKEPKTAPGILLNATQRIDAAEARAEELEAKIKDLEENAPLQELGIDALIEIEGRRRQLTDIEFHELLENLRNNNLITPISVRKARGEKFEIVSGHNRVAAFRELGRTSIPAFVIDADELQADIGAFYANLLQPSLPDYEKYLGFCMIRKKMPQMSHEAIADMAGMSRSQITKLMAFSGLPDEAHEILRQSTSALGATAAQELAAITKAGGQKKVVDAVSKLAQGSIDQKQAIRLASMAQAPPRPTTMPTRIRAGKTVYCEIRRTPKTIRIDFKSESAAADAEASLRDLLQTKATQNKESE